MWRFSQRLPCRSWCRRFFSGKSKSPGESEVSLGIKINLNFHWLMDNVEEVQRNIKLRGSDADAYEVRDLYTEYLDTKKHCEALRAERKSIARKMADKTLDQEARQNFIKIAKQIKSDIAKGEEELEQKEAALYEKALHIPNQTSDKTPPEEEQVIGFIHATEERAPAEHNLDIHHVKLGENLGIFDFHSASKVAGSNHACFMKKEGALLELALINFAVQHATSKGYTPVLTPDLARRAIVERCGFMPKGSSGLEDQIYQLAGSDLCLVGTSEIPLAGMLAAELLEEKELPLKFVAFSHCFRKEASGSGTDARGLYRMHQFSKVEMFAFATAQQSEEALEEILEIQKEIFELLELECRVIEMPATDLGAPASRKVDIEAWMPARGGYGEISSASNCLDYQSRRLDIRYKLDPDSKRTEDSEVSRSGKTAYVHTLNGTACAIPRTILAITEQHHNPDGSLTIPKALRPYMGGRERIG
mmetsp:Transcript_15786/g.30862  ORF Transcript_15786/g.30862 Transcript_15786/m.30862 type:complete len:476 (+) Transcript_15786:122-1549(+)